MTSTEFLLPQLPLGSAEMTIVRWLKRAGDSVVSGEPLLVAVNDRVEVALPATCAGILERPLAAEGAVVQAGAPVATIVAGSAALVGTAPSDQQISSVRISPVARRIVIAEHIDITELRGTGISGRIMKADVLADAPSLNDRAGRAYVGTSDNSPAPRRPMPVTVSSPHTLTLSPPHSSLVPYVLTATDIDMERVATAIAQHGPIFARRGLELSYIVCVALAAAAALPYHPLLNSAWADTMIVARRRVHLALVRAGTPPRCVRDAQDLNLRGLARALGGTTAEQSGEDYTFVIADLSDQVWGAPAALVGGQVAALGLGAVRARPWVIENGGVDRLAVRHAALLTLAFDARALDQHHADAFLRDVKIRLEHFSF